MHTLAKPFRELTRAAFARYGFAYADLIAQWPEIAGERVAQWSEPERIRWPRVSAGDRREGGTLVIRTVPGRGLDLQHEAPLILERINAFHGYRAIAQIKIIQAPLQRRTRPAPPVLRLDDTVSETLEHQIAPVEDPALKDALRRLGTGVLGSRSPQSK
jgi:hypothetical protein